MKKLTLPDSPGFNLLAGLACLLLLLLLIIFVSRGTAQDISAGLSTKANAALKDRGFDGITAQVEGRDVVLTGETTLDSTRIQAAEAVQRIAGMDELSNRITVNRSPRRRELFATNRPPSRVVRPQPPAPSLDASQVAGPSVMTPKPVAAKPVLPRPVAPKPTKPVNARPAGPRSVAPVPLAVPKPVLSRPVTQQPVAPSARPQLAPVQPKPIQPTPVNSTKRPSAVAVPRRFEPPQPSVAAPKPAVAPVVSRLAAATNAPVPYLLQLQVAGNQVSATGYLPDDAALEKLEQRVSLRQPITIQRANAPTQFTQAAVFAGEAASRMSRGTVRIADRDIRIEGWADGTVKAFIDNIESSLPPGYSLSVQVNSTGAGEASAGRVVETVAVADTSIAIAESFEPMDAQQIVGEALSCQSSVDSIMRGRTIAFQFASDALESRSEDFLSEVASAMNRCPNAYLYVIGHTDSVGTQDRNQRLSLRRASSVRDYLLNQGMFDDFVVAQGRGEKEPIFSNSTEKGRAGNRRIEFSVRSEPSL